MNMRYFNKRLLIGDAVIVSVLLCLSALSVLVFWQSDNSDAVKVSLEGEVVAVLPLDKDTVFSPDGGHTVVAVKNGRAYIESSDCPDGVCMEMSGVSNSGGSAVCLPNRVSISSASNKSALDGVVG